MSDDPYRYCIHCAADCYEDEPEHAADCPFTTGLWPVTAETLGMRGPDDPYALGMVCMDCGDPFAIGDTYALRQLADNAFEAVCIGCRVLNPEAA